MLRIVAMVCKQHPECPAEELYGSEINGIQDNANNGKASKSNTRSDTHDNRLDPTQLRCIPFHLIGH